MARTDNAPAVKYLKDYTAPDFSVDDLKLLFQIESGKTTVTATQKLTRTNTAAKTLRLDGEKMTLISIKRDGKVLMADSDYTLDDTGLTILNADSMTLEIVTVIEPEKNTALEGLYASGGNYCTQCEPEGFRKITYYLDRPDVMTKFTTRIEADAKTCPVLLSNGNCIDKGSLPNGRHFTVWEDPFVKPCYLFALVAGDLAHIHDTFTTKSGRKVDLYIYVNHGNEDKCDHAMQSLIKSMKWDEEVYGCEYDLDIFNIVAVNDFNFGAMENKSLNIFNAKLVLARPETATDADYLAIESVVAHEYFHNWTGNRITCRDWFQLSLKEGLTVFRDQEFSADMNSAAVGRIDDVEGLRNVQFAEDASPMAHPIRPDNYIEINNFYTATVYEKGAEIIRMQHTLLGAKEYRAATDLYFQRHDGQAVTCDDFVACMQDASGIDLSQFKRWYSQAGTPELTVSHHYDAAAKKLALTISQKTPATPGQPTKLPFHIPVAVGLIARGSGKDLLSPPTQILHLKEETQTFTFENIVEPAVPSVLRGFSAPVKVTSDLSDDDLLFLMAYDSDGFNRWDMGQTALQRLILRNAQSGHDDIPDSVIAAFGKLIADAGADKALLAKALTLPSEAYLSQLMPVVDIDNLHRAREALRRAIGQKFIKEWLALYQATAPQAGESYASSPAQVGRRRLRTVALRYIQSADQAQAALLAASQYAAATNMTDRMAALGVLNDGSGEAREKAMADFYDFSKHDPLMLDKWFSLQALADRDDIVEQVANLKNHPDFTLKNPNRLRALIGSLSVGNLYRFHRADGAGYRLLADTVLQVNSLNPSTAARLLTPLRQWRRFGGQRKDLMEKELKRILSAKDISNDVYEIVSKSLS